MQRSYALNTPPEYHKLILSMIATNLRVVSYHAVIVVIIYYNHILISTDQFVAHFHTNHTGLLGNGPNVHSIKQFPQPLPKSRNTSKTIDIVDQFECWYWGTVQRARNHY